MILNVVQVGNTSVYTTDKSSQVYAVETVSSSKSLFALLWTIEVFFPTFFCLRTMYFLNTTLKGSELSLVFFSLFSECGCFKVNKLKIEHEWF